MQGEPQIWVLTDDRAGHNAQSLGLAAQLPYEYEEKQLRFNWLSYISQWVLGTSLSSLEPPCQGMICPPWPDLVIAAGRRMIPIMCHIKQQSPSTKLVQCMWPQRIEPFDLIIAPTHDQPPADPHILQTVGALHRLTDGFIAHQAKAIEPAYAQLPRPYVAVLIGGSGGGWTMNYDDIKRLCDLSELLSDGGSLLITTSRRTPAGSAQMLRERLTCPYSIYEWGESTGANPYPGLLGIADAVVTTGDSIAMCTEACFSGKPTFIFTPQDRSIGQKHQRFLSHLFAQSLAQKLGPESSLGWQPRYRLNEMPNIAAHVDRLLFS